MNTIELLKKNSYKYANDKFNELKDTFLEMSVIKSEFDIEKLSIKRQGNFIAHNYHFLIRQYSLAMSELRRVILDKEEKMRKLDELKELQNKGEKKKGKKYIDIEIKRLENRIDMDEMGIVNKAYSCEHYEKCRQKLIELNGGKEPTNEQYQKEEPDYVKWYLEREMYYDVVYRTQGIRVGTLNNIDLLEEQPLINKDFKRIIEKENLNKIQDELQKQKTIDNRYNIKQIEE
jgi:hypothetical protein